MSCIRISTKDVINVCKKNILKYKNGEDIQDSNVRSVIQKYKQRSEIGLKKYGTTLDRDDLTFDEWLNHIQEELMDATLYIEKTRNELRIIEEIKRNERLKTIHDNLMFIICNESNAVICDFIRHKVEDIHYNDDELLKLVIDNAFSNNELRLNIIKTIYLYKKEQLSENTEINNKFKDLVTLELLDGVEFE